MNVINKFFLEKNIKHVKKIKKINRKKADLSPEIVIVITEKIIHITNKYFLNLKSLVAKCKKKIKGINLKIKFPKIALSLKKPVIL
jgi:replicative DNA helicase